MAEVVRRERELREMTQEQLAYGAGVSLRQVQRIERQESDPRLDTVRKLAGALGMSAARLVAMTAEDRTAQLADLMDAVRVLREDGA